MSTYRMQANATICFDVEADSEAEAIKKAEQAITDYSFGVDIGNNGTETSADTYCNVVMYTDEEKSADVLDVQ